MVPVSLYDDIELKLLDDEDGILFHPETSTNIPLNENNIAYKAASLFFEELGVKKGLEIKIIKNIPVEAGLGGGSSNAAAVLNGLNAIYSNPLSKKYLEKISSGLGADVPFFINSSPAYCSGVGDIIEPMGDLVKRYLIIINPGKGLSTALVYKKLNWGLTNKLKKNKRLLFEDCLGVKSDLINDLESVSEEIMAEIAEIKSHLTKAGADISMMSGSGPTCFGIFRDKKSRDKALESFISKNRTSWKVFSAEFV
jgi:4-diphosphocytidyl-2-C-methyl-D-erythritol kinase